MTTWHPATKLLLLAAVLAVPYLLLTQPDTPAAVAVPPGRMARGGAAETAAEPLTATSVVPYALPPLDQFAAVIERPLFSPTRRMPAPEVPDEPEEPTVAAPRPVRNAGPAEPELHFFGTVLRRGKVAALVSFPDTGETGRLVPGDKVGAWTVLQVQGDRLALGLGEERRTYEIFASPARETTGGGAAADVEPNGDAADEAGSDGAEDDEHDDMEDDGGDEPADE